MLKILIAEGQTAAVCIKVLDDENKYPGGAGDRLVMPLFGQV